MEALPRQPLNNYVKYVCKLDNKINSNKTRFVIARFWGSVMAVNVRFAPAVYRQITDCCIQQFTTVQLFSHGGHRKGQCLK